jgi:predicted enzyme related to lactoylglutathione lyase
LHYQQCQRIVAENVRVSEDGPGVPQKEKVTEIHTMHKSQLAGFIIDCQTDDIDLAAAFWSAALGLIAEVDPDPDELDYRHLETRPEEMQIEVQMVDHASRVHLDIETDNIEAEVARLEDLGARRIANIRRWVVMEAPTGQRFCVVRPQRANFDHAANLWD